MVPSTPYRVGIIAFLMSSTIYTHTLKIDMGVCGEIALKK